MSRALSLAEENPDHSVLRYAVHTLEGRRYSRKSGEYLLRLLMALCLRHHHLIGVLSKFLDFGRDANGSFLYTAELHAIVLAAAKSRRSDAMCWSIYLLDCVGIEVRKIEADLVIQSFDPCSIALLYKCANTVTKRAITRYVRKSILPRPEAIQRNWFLVHYLLNSKILTTAEVSDRTLVFMKQNSLNLFV